MLECHEGFCGAVGAGAHIPDDVLVVELALQFLGRHAAHLAGRRRTFVASEIVEMKSVPQFGIFVVVWCAWDLRVCRW